MNNELSDIILKANSDESKLNILVFPHDWEMEKELAKTGHNFYRLQLQEGDVPKDLPENYCIMPYSQVVTLFHYDIAMVRSNSVSQEIFNEIMNAVRRPFIVIDQDNPQSTISKHSGTYNNVDYKQDDFVENWGKFIKDFYEANKV